MFNRKVKKLIRDPKLFVSDMIKKKQKAITKVTDIKSAGNYEYTIISAVYNVGRYLEQYLKSITTQQLNFCNNIHLILVDDGSTDDSAEIIKKWQKKYPKNIIYLLKENGGQASARNFGLKYAKTEWVTFIDPDDFIDSGYFLSIDNFAKKNESKNINFISCNFIFYFDDLNLYKDTHPLKHRFAKGDVILPINDMGKHVQLSVNSAIFRLSKIRENDVAFDIEIKPSYEDAEFVSKYIFPIQSGTVAFLKSAKYFYRKRSDGTSTLDSAWEKPNLYSVVLQKGCINSMQQYVNAGRAIPENLQIKVLYHLFWYIKRLINNSNKLSFLSNEEVLDFKYQVHKIFSMIDEKIILQFGLAGCWFYHKVGMLACFKNTDPNFQIVYVEAFDKAKNLVQLRYFTKNVELEHITINGVDTIPKFAKTIKHDFLGEEFVNERRLWVLIESNDRIKMEVAGKQTNLSLAAKQEKNGIVGSSIIAHFENSAPKYSVSEEYTNAWVLMDRDNCADDNAEHLYRFIRANKPELKIFFAIRKNSYDWDRLEKEGFNLLDFESEEHLKALQSCSKVISSHADHCVTNLLGPKMLQNRHFVFLQHGITKDDLSVWLNQKDNIDCLITASKPEFESIVSNNSRYKFGKKEVVLTGFPRHDKLVSRLCSHEKTILIMPTWRSTIVGQPNKIGNERELKPDFIKTDYFKHWFGVIHSQRLAELCKSYGYKVIFHPHINVMPYLHLFNVPSYIETSRNKNIQELFSDSSMLVTDYSSVAFEMAVQSKPTLYYQFDEATLFNGAHTYSKGYYDYRIDGFGPVVTDEIDFFNNLEEFLKDDCKPSNSIISRIESTLSLRDANSCERVMNAILALDKPLGTDFFDKKLCIEYAKSALSNKQWQLAYSRWKEVFLFDDEETKEISKLAIVMSLNNSGRISEAINFISENYSDFENNRNFSLLREVAIIYMKLQNWRKASYYWNLIDERSEQDSILALQCFAEQQDVLECSKVFDDLYFSDYSLISIISNAWMLVSRLNWNAAKQLILAEFDDLKVDYFTNIQAHIILSHCEKKLENISLARVYLNSIKDLSNEIINVELEFSQLAFIEGDWKKTVEILNKYKNILLLLPVNIIKIYSLSLRMEGNLKDALFVIDNSIYKDFSEHEIILERAEIYSSLAEWGQASGAWIALIGIYDFAEYRLAQAYRMLGMIEEAFSLIKDVDCIPPSNMENWILRAELSQLVGKWDEVTFSWLSILREYPQMAPPDSWSKLSNAQLMQQITKMNSYQES